MIKNSCKMKLSSSFVRIDQYPILAWSITLTERKRSTFKNVWIHIITLKTPFIYTIHCKKKYIYCLRFNQGPSKLVGCRHKPMVVALLLWGILSWNSQCHKNKWGKTYFDKFTPKTYFHTQNSMHARIALNLCKEMELTNLIMGKAMKCANNIL